MSLALLLQSQNQGTTTDLTTVAAVRAFLQIPSTDDEQNAIIASLITRATRVIQVWTSREFAPADGAARSFVCGRHGHIDLAPFDLRAVTSVVYDTDPPGSELTLDASDYRLGPITSRDGVYQWVDIYRRHRPQRWRRDLVVTITGDWGYPSVPADVEDACIKTVGIWLKRDVSAFSRTYNLDEGRTERPEVLPAAVAAELAPYRPILVG
jgi:hypothetical protein